MRFARKLNALATLALALALAPAASAQQPAATPRHVAAGAAPAWQTIEPGGETTCATHAGYRFFVRPAASDRLLVFFSGGGACWTGENCDPDAKPTYQSEVPDAPPSGGIFDVHDSADPLAAYSMVFVSYCTGDAHLGDADTTYTWKDDHGAHSIRVHHRGLTNATAVLDWVYAHYPAPREIFVSGSSAGGVATPFYASLLARHYPQARVTALGDAASAYTKDSMAGVDQGRWGIPDVLRRYPGWEDYEIGGVPELYVDAIQVAPRVRFFQVDAAYDDAQRAYLQLAGTKDPDVAALIRQDHAEVARAAPAFRSFMNGGTIHTVLASPIFYTYVSDGHRFRDWVAAIVAGDTVPDVDCGACRRPDFAYSERDLEMLDHAIARLSTPGAWNPHVDTKPAPCPRDGQRVGVACALVDAARELDIAPGGAPALWDADYTARERIEVPQGERALDAFNDRPGTTLDDVIGLLKDVRARIAGNIRR